MADLDLKSLRKRWDALPGPRWIKATSCSYRRILTEYENKPVLSGTIHSDGQCDLHAAEVVLDAVTESRHVIPELLDIIEELQSKLDEAVGLDGMMLACSSRVKRGITKLQARLERSEQKAAQFDAIAYALHPDSKVSRVAREGDPSWSPQLERIQSICKDRDHWSALSLYLADLHAATALYEGDLSRTSKASRNRWQDICRQAAAMIRKEEEPPARIKAVIMFNRVLDRLDRAGDPS
jgi:hypothetical protein